VRYSSSCCLLSFFSSYGDPRDLHSFPTRRSSDLSAVGAGLYAYTLHQNGIGTPDDGHWYLRSELNLQHQPGVGVYEAYPQILLGDRKSTRLNSSHVKISYAVFCLKKKKQKQILYT